MSRFQECLALIISDDIEGGWTDDPDDTGGATNRGITLAVYADHLKLPITPDLKNRLRYDLTQAEIEDVYKVRYWNKVRGNDLPVGLDLAVFDWGVNSGPHRAITHLQTVLGVTVDGVFGKQTMAAVRAKMGTKLIVKYIDNRLEYLKTRPNYWKFKGGWVKRCGIIRVEALKAVGAATS